MKLNFVKSIRNSKISFKKSTDLFDVKVLKHRVLLSIIILLDLFRKTNFRICLII